MRPNLFDYKNTHDASLRDTWAQYATSAIVPSSHFQADSVKDKQQQTNKTNVTEKWCLPRILNSSKTWISLKIRLSSIN